MTPEGWQQVPLARIVRAIVETSEPSVNDERPYVALEHIAQGEPRLLGWSRAAIATSTKATFCRGDLLFGKLRPNLRKAVVAPFDGICSTDILVLRAMHGADSRYLQCLAHWPPFQAHAVSTASGTKMPRTSWALLAQFLTPLPPLAEQRKIAAILSSVDEAIEATQAVIDQLGVVKKAMMAELLTRGLPGRHTRFKQTEIGEVPEEWRTPLLDEVARRGSGHTPNKSHPEYWGGDIKWLSLADSWQLDRLHVSHTSALITPEGIANSSAVEHPAGTVVLSRDGSRLGKSAILTSSMAVSQHFLAWTCGEHLSNYFLYYWLQLQKQEFARIATGSTIPTIGLPYFKGLRVPLPPVAEQVAVAEAVKSVDLRIFEEERSVEVMRVVKSALSSVLLTGEVRVTPDPEPAP